MFLMKTQQLVPDSLDGMCSVSSEIAYNDMNQAMTLFTHNYIKTIINHSILIKILLFLMNTDLLFRLVNSLKEILILILPSLISVKRLAPHLKISIKYQSSISSIRLNSTKIKILRH